MNKYNILKQNVLIVKKIIKVSNFNAFCGTQYFETKILSNFKSQSKRDKADQGLDYSITRFWYFTDSAKAGRR